MSKELEEKLRILLKKSSYEMNELEEKTMRESGLKEREQDVCQCGSDLSPLECNCDVQRAERLRNFFK